MRVPAVFALWLVIVACGQGEPAATTSTAASSMSSTTTIAMPTTTVTTMATTSSVPRATTTSSLEVDVEFSGGEVSGPEVFEVDVGDTVDIWVLSDVDDEMHVHGYDLIYELKAGEPFNLKFPADIPGIFEVEVHTGHTLLFELRVSG